MTGASALINTENAAASETTPTAAPVGYTLDNRMTTDEQWSAFLKQQDLLWRRMPTTWYEGPFLGNGRLASGVYQEPGTNQVRFTVQHAEVQDHRPRTAGTTGAVPAAGRSPDPRTRRQDHRGRPAGRPVERRTHRHASPPTRAASTLRALVHATRKVLVVTRHRRPASERSRWMFHPAEAISPRNGQGGPAGRATTPNPPWTTTQRRRHRAVPSSRLVAGGQTATAYRDGRRHAARQRRPQPSPDDRRRGEGPRSVKPSRARSPIDAPRHAHRAGGTPSTARASCRSPTSGCRASTGSSSTRSRRPAARAAR